MFTTEDKRLSKIIWAQNEKVFKMLGEVSLEMLKLGKTSFGMRCM